VQTLAQTLQDHDRGHLKVIADLWQLELPDDPQPVTIKVLSRAMLDRTPEILETLPGGARRALDRMLLGGGRVPMESLVRQFGPLREMGPGKRDRLEPWKVPASPLEMLWYRGLMSKAFADSDGGPQEYGFVPDDLVDRMPGVTEPETLTLGEPTAAPSRILRSGGFAVDDATTILAAHRRDEKLDPLQFVHQPESLALLEALLEQAEILGHPEHIGAFLQLTRTQALDQLRETWKGSRIWNDLSQTSGVRSPTGEWPNDPRSGREAALELLRTVPADTWWSVAEFVNAVHEAEPGFMRPPGGFESWYLQSADEKSNLHGFEAWEQVEGQYLRYLITGPMLWLGLSEISQDGSAFQLAHSGTQSKEGLAKAWPDGRIRVARQADRALRYQVARLCEWEQMDRGAYHYRLTARSLRAAEEQGLTAAHAHQILAEIPAPEGMLKALKRWEQAGMEAEVGRQTVLQVEDEQVLALLMNEPSTHRYLGERLGPKSVVVDSAKWKKLREAALQLGLLIGDQHIDSRP